MSIENNLQAIVIMDTKKTIVKEKLLKSNEANGENTIISPDKFREQLLKNGVTLKKWAEDRGYNPEYCSKVLNGMVKGTRGIGHEIAVAMGIK